MKSLLLLFLLLAGPVHAQTVRGTLVEESGKPLPRTLVMLLDAQGAGVNGALTDPSGAFLLTAPAPGRYRLKAERIGYASALSPVLELAAGETLEHLLVAPAQPVALEGLVVQAEKRRCSLLPEAGRQTAALWEEARKALSAAAWTDRRRPFRFDVVRYDRTLEPRTGEVKDERMDRSSRLSSNPFVSLPAEQLAREGFVRQVGDSLVYFGPDAHVLLSDEFLEGHCFRVREGEEQGLIGLAFEPIRGRRLPDVRGVLWIDPESAELRYLEYSYTGVEVSGPAEQVGGRMEFERLPSGEWYIPRWRIRMPLVAIEQLRVGTATVRRRKVLGIQEEAGEVSRIRTLDGGLVRSTQRATLAGTVFDSTRAAPLPGARVRLEGTAVAVTADSLGRFHMEEVAEGRYLVSFQHPRADSLEFTPPAVPVQVRRDGESSVPLAIPPLQTVLAERCSPMERRPGSGVVGGAVRLEGAGTLPPGTPVVISWKGSGDVPAGRAVSYTDALGHYVVCSVPAGVALEVRVGSLPLAAAEVRASGERVARHDLSLARREVAIDPLVVTATSAAERSARASGVRQNLLLRADIEQMQGIARHAGDLVRRFPAMSVREVEWFNGSGLLKAVCATHARLKSGCALVVINDVPVPVSDQGQTLARLAPHDIESVEFIPAITARSRYGTAAQGGALVIYTVGRGPHAKRDR